MNILPFLAFLLHSAQAELECSRKRIEFLQGTLEESFKGLENLKEKAATLPDHLRSQLGGVFPPLEEDESSPEELGGLLSDLLEHTVRAQQRAWGRVIDTTMDIRDPKRAPKAPKTLSDLKTEIEGLEKTLLDSEESFGELLNYLGKTLAQLLQPMRKVMEGMLQMGGEFGMETLKKQVDNMMGKVLLRVVIDGQEGTTAPFPSLFKEPQDFVRSIQNHFNTLGRKIPLEEFWESEWKRLVERDAGKEIEERDEEEEDDPLYADDINFVTALVEQAMLKSKN